MSNVTAFFDGHVEKIKYNGLLFGTGYDGYDLSRANKYLCATESAESNSIIPFKQQGESSNEISGFLTLFSELRNTIRNG